jgi:hypothetical protein
MRVVVFGSDNLVLCLDGDALFFMFRSDVFSFFSMLLDGPRKRTMCASTLVDIFENAFTSEAAALCRRDPRQASLGSLGVRDIFSHRKGFAACSESV